MVAKKVTVSNATSLHRRPAQLLARAVAPFECGVDVICGGRAADARSIMSLMAACVRQGDEIEIRCCGRQERQALAAAAALVESGFGGRGPAGGESCDTGE